MLERKKTTVSFGVVLTQAAATLPASLPDLCNRFPELPEDHDHAHARHDFHPLQPARSSLSI